MIRFSLVASAAVVAFALSACAPASETPVLSEEETELLMTGDRDLTPYLTQDFSWGSCPTDWLFEGPSSVLAQSEVECGTVLVPATYQGNQDIPDFALAVMRVIRDGADSKPHHRNFHQSRWPWWFWPGTGAKPLTSLGSFTMNFLLLALTREG